MRQYPSIVERCLTLLINAAIAYAVFVSATNRWLPTAGTEAVWFGCALSYWFLSLLAAPWFLPPRDAIPSGLGAFLVLVTMEIDGSIAIYHEVNAIRWIAIAYAGGVVLIALVAILLHSSDERSPVGRFAFRMTSIFGRGELLFSPPAILSIVSAYHASFALMSSLLLYWLLIAIGKPVELLAAAWRQLRDDLGAKRDQPMVGVISRIDHPNIVRVRLSSMNSWAPNRLFTISMPDGSQQFAVSLFTQMQGSDVVGTGLCVATAQEQIRLPNGGVCSSHDDEKTASFLEALSGAKDAKMVGFVIENSSIGIIAFEVAANSDLSEGDVVFARISGEDIFYQIVGAETFEENFDQNPRGTLVVKAAQLGIYSAQDGFSKYPWLPGMNTPLFSAGSRQFEKPIVGERELPLGCVPSTEVEVIARLDDLIEFHTAILGVTGTGKTEVALDLVRASATNGVKVFCVDFTGDYRSRLADLDPIFPNPDRKKAFAIEGLLAVIDAYGFKAPDEKKRLRQILDDVKKDTEKAIDDFLRSENQNIAIFELPEISNSKAGLRLTEIYLSAIMNWARENRRQKRVLICLEEAHTIVPEAFGSGFDGETKWVVERIGQIALQGRKYGVGLLVITQRTALVSKTILSQCNTFLTHSLIDHTSLNFLESVYSSQHTRLIPNLGKFEFLASGKALKAERPVILRRKFDPEKLKASLAVHPAPPERVGADNEPLMKAVFGEGDAAPDDQIAGG